MDDSPEIENRSGVTHIGDILAALRANTPLGQQLENARIWEYWNEAAGEPLCHHGRPYALRNGTLRVHVDGAVWMSKFSYRKWKIIKHLNRRARKPLVNDLFLTLDPEQEPD